MRKIFVIINLLVLSLFSNKNRAQNFIPNSSFEIYTSCPTGASQLHLAFPWIGATTNSTDYFNTCSSGSTNVPFSGGGFQQARTGNAYAGLWVINPFGYNYREYLRIKLDSTLQLDSCYLVEFFCSLDNASRFGINKLGAYLSTGQSNTVGPGLVLQNMPQIESTSFLSDTLNWMRVSGYYEANGGEQYITIGNFRTDALTDTIHTGGSYPGSYYLIDDVKVEKIKGCDSTSLGISAIDKDYLFRIYPNPNNGNCTLEYDIGNENNGILEIRDITGKLISHYELFKNGNRLMLQNEHLDNGIYFCNVIVDGSLLKSEKLVVIK